MTRLQAVRCDHCKALSGNDFGMVRIEAEWPLDIVTGDAALDLRGCKDVSLDICSGCMSSIMAVLLDEMDRDNRRDFLERIEGGDFFRAPKH